VEDGFFLYPVLPIQHLSHPAEIQSVDHAVRMQVSLCRLRLGQRLAAEQMPKQQHHVAHGDAAVQVHIALCLSLPGLRHHPGIGIQNLPEGAAISLPLRQEGSSRGRAFLLGTLSGSVEPIFGILVVLVAAGVRPLMPWLLSFAAGAMLYVVVEELVPQAHSKAGTCGFVGGFLIMMILDVALG